ncbi:hypothetical protein H9Y04_18180 [Streptomyces sp. TRM66268-LWL]|uniref:Uncharacterized protein n=1 Tax=Streptomyces polyasparticus TaxID=2767826 RepID=A0ABR7SIT0_9ACTN|nr:hypothetical protein [Streptomyces polyasparticus]MBC9714492.1 hypothetical protein [Streptomyces polyasparticus]
MNWVGNLMPVDAPWQAVIILLVLVLLVFGACKIAGAVWPQESADRAALLKDRQRRRDERRRARVQERIRRRMLAEERKRERAIEPPR